jgi:hypothetical protein
MAEDYLNIYQKLMFQSGERQAFRPHLVAR